MKKRIFKKYQNFIYRAKSARGGYVQRVYNAVLNACDNVQFYHVVDKVTCDKNARYRAAWECAVFDDTYTLALERLTKKPLQPCRRPRRTINRKAFIVVPYNSFPWYEEGAFQYTELRDNLNNIWSVLGSEYHPFDTYSEALAYLQRYAPICGDAEIIEISAHKAGVDFYNRPLVAIDYFKVLYCTE